MNGKNEGRTYEVNRADTDRVRVRLRVGDKEMEIEGNEEYVNRQAGMFLSHLVSGDRAYNENVLVSKNDTDTSTQATPKQDDIPIKQSPTDLITLFQEKSPSNQRDEVLLITSYYQKYLGRESITLEDYTEAYTILKRLAVDIPSNMKSSVRNVVDRTKFLYNPDRGQFALTLQGEQLVENLGGNND